MPAPFYWDAVKRYWWLILLPAITIAVAIVALETARGRQYQSSIYFMVNSPYALTSRDYSRGASLRQSPTLDDEISSSFDFTTIANSLQVAAKTISDLNLPVDNAIDLLKPPMTQLRPPSVLVQPSQPSGDAASKGMLTELLGIQLSDISKVQPSTRWVQLTALAYDRDLAAQLAQTYAGNALAYYRSVQAQNATDGQQQVVAHVQEARQRLDAAGAEVARFENAHQLLSGGAEFQSAQTVLENLQRDRTSLLGAQVGQKVTSQRRDELAQQIAALDQQAEQQGRAAAEAQARYQGARAAADARLAAAQSDYSVILQTYQSAAREFSLARAQGFPSAQVTVQSSESAGGQSTTSSTETSEAFTSTATETQRGYAATSVQQQGSYVTTATVEQKADQDLVSVQQASSSATTDSASAGTTTTSSSSQTTTTTPASNRATTTTSTTTYPAVTNSSTTTYPESSSITTSTTPARTSSNSATTTTKPSITTVTTEQPTAIQSEEQGTAYLAFLGQAVDEQSRNLIARQQGLADVESNSPAALLNNELQLTRDKLASARSAHSTLLRLDSDATAGVEALDAQIGRQEQRVAELNRVAPEYRRLTTSLDQVRAEYEETLRLAGLYSRVRMDAATGAGIQLIDQSYTMPLASKLPMEVIFGVGMGLLFGLSLAFLFGYIRYLRNPEDPAGPGHSARNGAAPLPTEEARSWASIGSGSQAPPVGPGATA